MSLDAIANNLWIERYRPRTVAECILPDRLKAQLTSFVNQGEIPHLMLAGPAGTGKTTAARALAHDLGCDLMTINASEENGIDTIRGKVRDFASTVSIMNEAKHKIILLDEADYLSRAAQAVLRGMIEEFWHNCRFIFTCNYKNRIIDGLHSRTSIIDFSISGDDQALLMASFYKRVTNILRENDITWDGYVLADFIKAHFPDFRRTLNELQRYGTSGKIDAGILQFTGEGAITDIVGFLRTKNFKEMRTWVDVNSAVDIPVLFDKLYDSLGDYLEPQSIPDLILILDEYQNKAVVVVNQRINLAACFTQCMAALAFK